MRLKPQMTATRDVRLSTIHSSLIRKYRICTGVREIGKSGVLVVTLRSTFYRTVRVPIPGTGTCYQVGHGCPHLGWAVPSFEVAVRETVVGCFLCCKHDHQVGRGPQLGPAVEGQHQELGV